MQKNKHFRNIEIKFKGFYIHNGKNIHDDFAKIGRF
jgi:hypothetical protein